MGNRATIGLCKSLVLYCTAMGIASLSILIMGCKDKILLDDPDNVPKLTDSNPVWSFDGSRIAYFSLYDSNNSPSPGIYITDSTASFKTKVGISGYVSKWLPGDSELIVNDGHFGGFHFFKINLNTVTVTDLGFSAEVGVFDVSRDGEYLYYSSQKTDSIWSSAIHRYSLDSGTTVPIISGENPAISYDESKLAFHRGALYVFDLNDSTLIQLAPKGTYPVWTPDGQHIFYNDGFGNVYRVDMSGNRIFIVKASEVMSVSPNGTRLIFSRSAADRYMRIWMCNIDGSDLVQITH